MEIRYFDEERKLVFKITEEIDECSVKDIRRRADFEIERFMPKEVIFDFNRVTFMDSAGIGMLIGRYKQANIIGGTTKVANLSIGVRKILEMSGVLKIIPEIIFQEKDYEKNRKEEVINIWVNFQIMK